MKPHVAEALETELAERAAARTRAGLPEDYDHLRLARGELVTPDGRIPVKKIGEGMFAKVYREQVPPGRVFAFTPDDVYDKEIVAMARDEDHPNPHLPAVEKFGHTADATVYEMPYYAAPLKKSASERAWKDYTVLRDCFNLREALDAERGVACAKEHRWGVDPQVVAAMDDLAKNASNYGEYAFELSPRNLATDEAGNLVLLDVLFDKEQVRKRAAARGW